MWTLFGFSSFLTLDDSVEAGPRELIILLNCVIQGVDAGILIQANLYAGNAAGKKKFSLPFVLLFVALAINIGSRWSWHALILSLPGAILIILGQKTVFGARRRGDYTMQNAGAASISAVTQCQWVLFLISSTHLRVRCTPPWGPQYVQVS